MKKLQQLHHIRQLRSWLRSSRKILLPVLSVPGVLFFVLYDYEYYPWLTLFFLCVFMSYIIWGILHLKNFAMGRDAEGNLVLYDKNSRDREQKRLEQEMAAIEQRLHELNQQNNQHHEQH